MGVCDPAGKKAFKPSNNLASAPCPETHTHPHLPQPCEFDVVGNELVTPWSLKHQALEFPRMLIWNASTSKADDTPHDHVIEMGQVVMTHTRQEYYVLSAHAFLKPVGAGSPLENLE